MFSITKSLNKGPILGYNGLRFLSYRAALNKTSKLNKILKRKIYRDPAKPKQPLSPWIRYTLDYKKNNNLSFKGLKRNEIKQKKDVCSVYIIYIIYNIYNIYNIYDIITHII